MPVSRREELIGALSGTGLSFLPEDLEKLSASNDIDILTCSEKTSMACLAIDCQNAVLLGKVLQSFAKEKEDLDISLGSKRWLFTAIDNKDAASVRVLLQYAPSFGIDPREDDDDCIFWACHKGYLPVVEHLIDYLGDTAAGFLAKQNRLGLVIAVEEGHGKVLDFFVKKGLVDLYDSAYPLSLSAAAVIEKATPELFDYVLRAPASRGSFIDKEGTVQSGVLIGLTHTPNADLVTHMFTKSKDRPLFMPLAVTLLNLSLGQHMDSVFVAVTEAVKKDYKERDDFMQAVEAKIKAVLVCASSQPRPPNSQFVLNTLIPLRPHENVARLYLENMSKEVLDWHVAPLPEDIKTPVIEWVFNHFPDLKNHPLVTAHHLKKHLPEYVSNVPTRKI